MTPEQIRAACLDAGLADATEAILKTALPALRIVSTPADEGVLPVGASKIGGRPDLPGDLAWPERDGLPLAFLAQLDLGALSAHPECRRLPGEGLLAFFYNAAQDTWGFDPADRDGFRVIHVVGQTLERRPFPGRLDPAARFAPCTMAFERELTLPAPDSPAIEALGLDETALDAYLRALEALEPLAGETDASRVLGHPDQVQGDMQLECALVTEGLYCGDPSGYEDPRAAELGKEAPHWRLLLQVCSDDGAGMMWGDLGFVYFWIHQRDLEAGRFEKAWAILQCS